MRNDPPNWRPVFLMMNARSGSTFLSRLLHESFTAVAVPPEIDLVRALDVEERGGGESEMCAALVEGRFFEALEVDASDFPRRYQRHGSDLARTVRSYLDEYGEREIPEGGAVVLKKGTHAFRVEGLRRWFPEAAFIGLHRDPRAVFESKRRTVRPYHPGQTMAWMGVFGAAVRWRQFADRMLAIEDQHGGLTVRLEDLFAAQDEQLVRIAVHLELGERPESVPTKSYRIPDAEASIHAGAAAGVADSSRLGTWETELTPRELWVTERVARPVMVRLGYEPVARAGLKGPGWLIASAAETVGRVLARAFRAILRKRA